MASALPGELLEDRVVAVLRAPVLANTAAVVDALVQAGIRSVELTWTIAEVLEHVGVAAGVSGAVVGVGTVLRAEQVDRAAGAGAAFVVTPGLRPAVAAAAARRGVPCLAGAWTPTEVAEAADLAPAAIKLFPAQTGGPAHLRALRGPFDWLDFIPSGGVSPATVGEWLEAGAVAVSAGTSVADPAALTVGDASTVHRGAVELVQALGRA